jgi:hypothetical protein
VGIAVSLLGLALRVAIGLAIALLAAIPMTLIVFRDDFKRSFAVACLLIGCLALMMAFGGSSPSRRMGVQDPWFASFFPKLVRPMGEQYSQTRLSDAAVFVLAGLALIVIGFALLG